MSAQESATTFASPQFSSKGAVVPKEPPLDLRLNSNLEVEIANQALVNGDITLSLLYVPFNRVLERNQPDYWARSEYISRRHGELIGNQSSGFLGEMNPPCVSCFRGGDEL